MARKTDFTKKDKNTIDVARVIATSNTRNVNDTKDATDEKEEYRFSARFTPTQWKYLTEKKWTTRKSITQILQDYVEEDIKKHPEIIKGIDELNG